jgi:uncharacterized membrane protein YebE (DUF533 family)
MKKIFVIVLLTMVTVIAYAQQTPVADQRQRNQQVRIREGVVTGDLTRTETRRLRTEQRHIRRTERRAKADGTVTSQERRKIQRKQNRASRDIRRQKTDGQ